MSYRYLCSSLLFFFFSLGYCYEKGGKGSHESNTFLFNLNKVTVRMDDYEKLLIFGLFKIRGKLFC